MPRWSRRCWLGALCALAVSCLSPTLPLPPPAEPNVTGPNEQGLVTLTGTVRQPRAMVQALNLRTDTLAGRRADDGGQYQFQIVAEVGDTLYLWYEYAAQESDRLTFEVPGPRSDTGVPLVLNPPNVTGPDANGVVVLTGIVPLAAADVLARDQRTGAISGSPADESGAYRIELEPVAVGDVIELWYSAGDVTSEHVTVTAGENG